MKKLLIKLLNQEINKHTNPTGSVTYYEAGNISLRVCSFIVSFIKDNTNFWFYCPAINNNNNKPEKEDFLELLKEYIGK